MIIGHQKQWQFLKRSADRDRLAHAYLFLGQAHLGKRKFAKDFVKFLNCRKKENPPCQACWACKALEKEIHPDLIFIKPIGREIKISQIRQLQKLLSLKPHSSPFKSVIIDDAEKMNQEAQSCLLKTLEEPQGATLLFLIAERHQMLLFTILSRVQRIKFFPVPKVEIEKKLKDQENSPKNLKTILAFSFGKPGLALEFLQDPKKLDLECKRMKEIAKIAKEGLIPRFQYVKDILSREEKPEEILSGWAGYFRDILKVKMGLPSELAVITGPQSELPLAHIKKNIDNIEKINFLISSTNINVRLALEVLMLKI